MRKVYFLVILFLILAIFLNGCGVVTPPIPGEDQEERVKGTVNGYWSALSNRQYELAKSYCVLNGDAYNLAKEYQDIPYIGSSTLTFKVYFNYIEINGNNAKANINLTLTATVCFTDICATESETLYNYSMYLKKISGTWKLK